MEESLGVYCGDVKPFYASMLGYIVCSYQERATTDDEIGCFQ